ncbi:hypothetical protein IFM89_019251 [Coptis chinensis]|uniref:Retrotransposon gag domain-containing protein n=1 Tax=Coptis chinensis TaxID=261450 RepID=A0A835HNQ0_9MAGN|nr:hypothetical protein IFM89_019251 [Coptis chinensis]
MYDEENGDPYTHLFYYRSQMAMENDDALLCKLFPATLKGDALVWFNSLTSKSIRNFPELAKKFVDHYQYNCEIKQDSAALFNLTKNSGESIRDFRKRFQTLLNVTDPPSDQFIIQAFKDAIGYDRSGLYNSLTRQPPFSKSELFDCAEEFARVEDDLKARQLREENLQKNKKESGRNSSNYKGQDKNKQNNFQSGQNSKPTQPNKEEKIFTPLSMKLSEVYERIKGRNLLYKPRPLPEDTTNIKDKSKRCKFHDDFGHTTDDCRILRSAIQRLVDDKKLDEFIQKAAQVKFAEHMVIRVGHARLNSISNNQRKFEKKQKFNFLTDWNRVNSIDFLKGDNARNI